MIAWFRAAVQARGLFRIWHGGHHQYAFWAHVVRRVNTEQESEGSVTAGNPC